MKHLVLLLALVAPLPAVAQFYPNLAAVRYCRLRQMGMDYHSAIRIAIAENQAPGRYSPMVNYQGIRASIDVVEFGDVVSRLYPAYLR